MNITRIHIDHLPTPMGFAHHRPVLTWIAGDTDALRQAWARIEVASDADFTRILWDTGEQPDISSLGYPLELPLTPRTRYHIRLTVCGDNGDQAQKTTWFETGKQDEAWLCPWITAPEHLKERHLLLRRSFNLPDNVAQARLYICGYGLFKAHINGRSACDEHLTPFFNNYDAWQQALTLDVTDMLQKGENALGVHLGKGWYMGRFGGGGGKENLFGDRMCFICELHVTLQNGETLTFGSDDAWRCHASYITDSSIYDGEYTDLRLQPQGWTAPNYDDGAWDNAQIYHAVDTTRLTGRRSPPVRIQETRPLTLIRTPKGEQVLDAGQNMTGWLRFNLNAPMGATLRLQYGEVLQDGCFYRENLRTAKAEYVVISDGEPAVCEPQFTFYGFRYVLVEGLDTVNPADFTACVVYSDMETIGTAECGNPLVNQLLSNALWGLKGNFLDVPTDCPQRDERMGWTGDAQIFAGTALYFTHCAAFFKKYLHDMCTEQEAIGGCVPFTVPQKGNKQQGSAAWGDAATVIPWNLYLHTGDRRILEEYLPNMRLWVDYIRSRDEAAGGKRLWLGDFHFGDWLSLDSIDPKDRFGGTDKDYIASAFYAYSAGLTAKAAGILGQADVAAHYENLSREVCEAIRREFFTRTGRLSVDTQTAHALALYMNLGLPEWRERLVRRLEALLNAAGKHLRTGFVGTPYLCPILSAHGLDDLAYTLLLNEDFPSWLYAVRLGATTIWERWNSVGPDGKISETGMNSLNHYAYGSIAEWMFREMCGIQPLEPGFRRALLTPKPERRLGSAKGALRSAAGLYQARWRFAGEDCHISVSVPFNCEAELRLPGTTEAKTLLPGQHSFAVKGL